MAGLSLGEAKGGIILPRYARGAVAIAICCLPLLTPAGPGNTGPVDAAVLVAIVCVAFAGFSEHIAMRLPLALPVWMSILAGGLGAVVHNRAAHSSLMLSQDILMLLWGGAVATAAQHGPTLKWLMRWWVKIGIVSSFGLVIGVETGIKSLSGYSLREANRAAFLFGDPNRCGLYLMMAFLIMRAAQYPRRPINRYAVGTIMLYAILLTGSNAAIAGLAVALVVSAFIGAGRRGNVVTLFAWGSAAIILGGAMFMTLNLGAVSSSASGNSLLANNLGRASKSTDSRSTILQEDLNMFFVDDDFFGLGPDGTKATLKATEAAYVKEAHNDYVAAMTERGLLGLIALITFICLIGTRAGVMLSLKPPEHLLKYVPRPDLLGSGALGVAVTGAFHQTLHFRHEWAFFGLLCGAAILAKRGDGVVTPKSAIVVPTRDEKAPADKNVAARKF